MDECLRSIPTLTPGKPHANHPISRDSPPALPLFSFPGCVVLTIESKSTNLSSKHQWYAKKRPHGNNSRQRLSRIPEILATRVFLERWSWDGLALPFRDFTLQCGDDDPRFLSRSFTFRFRFSLQVLRFSPAAMAEDPDECRSNRLE